MQKGLIRKGLVFSVIILLIGVGINSSSGNLIINNKKTSRGVTISFSPSEPDGDNGWYITDVTVNFHADNGTIIDYIKVRVDGGSVQTFPGGGPIFIYEEGNYSYEFCAVDTEENQWCFGPYQIKIDYFPPVTDLTWLIHKVGFKWYVEFTLTAHDTISGMSSWLEIYINDAILGEFEVIDWSAALFEIRWFKDFKNVKFGFGCYDNAGNFALESINGSDIKSYHSSQHSNNQQSTNLLLLRFLEQFPLLNLILQRLRT